MVPRTRFGPNSGNIEQVHSTPPLPLLFPLAFKYLLIKAAPSIRASAMSSQYFSPGIIFTSPMNPRRLSPLRSRSTSNGRSASLTTRSQRCTLQPPKPEERGHAIDSLYCAASHLRVSLDSCELRHDGIDGCRRPWAGAPHGGFRCLRQRCHDDQGLGLRRLGGDQRETHSVR